MAKAPHLELGTVPGTAVKASGLPLGVTDPLEPFLKGGLAMQTVIIGDSAAIAQQIAVPILAPTDATVARFD